MCRIACTVLLQRLKGSMSGDARDFDNIEARAVTKFFFLGRQGAEGNSRHSERNIRGTCTIACHRQTQESLVHISLMRKSYKQPIPTHDGE